ncbi:MAG: peptidase E [Chloroflexota bacterium]|nr:peptidase E [Chloroflexota bacterium]
MTDKAGAGQIVAMGGGGFSMEPENLLLDRYVLGLVNRKQPRVCFVPTASGDAQSYIDRFLASFGSLPCHPTHLSLFNPPTADLQSFVGEQDVIYVGGGNTRNLLVLWREWGLDVILRDAWERGAVLAGISAGSICWFDEGVTDSILGRLTPLRCLGFLPGSNCPHYDGEPERRPAYQHLVANGELSPGYAADDGVALHFAGTRLERIISSRPHARAYRLERRGEGVEETAIVPQYLGTGGETGGTK